MILLISLILILIALVVGLYVLYFYLPTKRTMSDIYQEMYRKQDKQTKMISDVRNIFFANSRKSLKNRRDK